MTLIELLEVMRDKNPRVMSSNIDELVAALICITSMVGSEEALRQYRAIRTVL